MNYSNKIGVGLLMAAMLGLTPFTATTQAATLNFTQSNLFSSGTAQNWGTLTTTCASGSCTVSLTPTGDTFFGNEFLGFNLASGATGLTLSSTLSTAGASYTTGSFNLDGFGTFTSLIGLQDGPSSGYSSTVTLFTVNYTGADTSLFTLNTSNFDAAGHVLLTGTECTGYVGAGTGLNNGSSANCVPPPPPAVPEPMSLLLFGLGALAVGYSPRLMLGEGWRNCQEPSWFSSWLISFSFIHFFFQSNF